MKKRIGNDITFTWHIYRNSGESQTPESFDGKEVEVKLMSPLKQPVTIEDVSIATGVVTFTFRGKHQVTLGNYVAVLQENKGEDGMVTLDVVSAVTLVAHSYMEEDDDDGDVIEASSVELESSISAGGGGGLVQQQADWAQTDDTAVDFIKNKPDLDVYCRKDADNTHSDGVSDTFAKLVFDEHNPSVLMQADRLTVGGDSIKFYHSHRGEDSKELSLQIDDVEKLKNLPTDAELSEVATSGSYNDLTDKPTIPAAQVQSDWDESDTTSPAFIHNKPEIGGSTAAADVSYDNTRTGLSATNVQDAIDKMVDTNLYETVVLTVGSADSSFSPVGQTITVTLEDGSATQYTVPMSRQITFIVQRGMRYNISGTSTDDYRVLPISVIAAIPTRYLTMRYIPIATGVFILQKDGNYYLREEYDAETMAEDAVGVLVLTSALINAGHGIVISKDIPVTPYTSWASSNSTSTTSYDGLARTERMSAGNAACAVWCYSLRLEVDGEELIGFIGSYAEGHTVYMNVTEINLCMAILNGYSVPSDGAWRTSTYGKQYGSSYQYMTAYSNNNYCDQSNYNTLPFFYYPLS